MGIPLSTKMGMVHSFKSNTVILFGDHNEAKSSKTKNNILLEHILLVQSKVTRFCLMFCFNVDALQEDIGIMLTTYLLGPRL